MITLTNEGCRQIEMAVLDVPAAIDFMKRTLGAEPIEQELVQMITGMVLDIDHVDLGQAIFQFCSVITDGQPHQRYLDAMGPSVTNLSFGVADQVEADRVIAAAGGTTLTRFAMSNLPWRQVLGNSNTRPNTELGDGVFSDTHELIGFDFEYSQSPWERFDEQQIMWPAFRTGRPTVPGRVDRLLHVRAIVHDLDRTLQQLKIMFDAASCSAPYNCHETCDGKSTTVRLDGLEIQYCQPTHDDSA